MTLRNFTFGTAVALATLATGPVKAADLDPALEDPVETIQSMPVSNVVFGSGWYVRGDAAVTNGYLLHIARPNTAPNIAWAQSSPGPDYGFSLGGGYAFTHYIRADITADLIQSAQALLKSGANFGSLHQYNVLANGYFDLGTWSILTPYIGAGVGAAFNDLEDTNVNLGARANAMRLAYAGMAGVAFDVYPHLKIDVGYRYVNNGKVGGAELAHHEFRAGLRYMIDN